MARIDVSEAEPCLEALDIAVEAIEVVNFHQADLCQTFSGLVAISFAC